MALSSDLQPFSYKYLRGMNNKGEPLEFEDKFVVKAQNLLFDPEPGGITKRPPLFYFNNVTMASSAVTGLYRYYKSDGTSKFVSYCGTNVFVGDDTSGTFTSIRSNMTLGARITFQTYKDLLMGGNGFDPIFVYDGLATNVTWQLGACKAWTGASVTNMTVGSVTYQITLDSDAFVTGALSNTVTITGCSIILSNLPLGPIGTTNRKIYRKDSTTGSQYKYIATVPDNIATTYTDSNTTTSSVVVPAVTDAMPKGAELQIYRERLFVSRDPQNTNRIYYSNPYLPNYIQQTTNLDYLDISPNDNDVIVGIPNYLGTMLCIKKNTIRKLSVSDPLPDNWYAEDPWTYSAGSPAPWSICATPYGIAWLGWDHWYMFDGANPNIIIDEFDTTQILLAGYNDTATFFCNNELFAAYTFAKNYHDRCMRYNFKRKALAIDTINVNCFTAQHGDNENGTLYYGDSTTGYVYQAVYTNSLYKVSSQDDCNSGTLSNTFVGGTEANSFITIGNSVTPSSIPNNLCIFWNSTTPPDSGWTSVTGYDERYLMIGTANATGFAGVSVNPQGQSTTSSIAINWVDWGLYYKNNTTTVNTFPVGSIILYDQANAPEGYVSMLPNYYVRISNTSIGTIGQDTIWSATANGMASTIDNYLAGNFIQLTSEVGSWDGIKRYAYCPTYNATVSSNGWTDASATYNGLFLQSQQENLTISPGGDTDYGLSLCNRSATLHTYVYLGAGTATGAGVSSIDGDFTTFMGQEQPEASGKPISVSTTLYSQHVFQSPYKVTYLNYRLWAKGRGSAVGSWSTDTRLEYTDLAVSIQGDADGCQAVATVANGTIGTITVVQQPMNPFGVTPNVTIVGNGSGATATATIDANGSVSSITVTNRGIGYSASYPNWTTITGTEISNSGGEGSNIQDTGQTSMTVNLPGCAGIRAYSHATGGSADGHAEADSRIYEIQAFGDAIPFLKLPLATAVFGQLNDWNQALVVNTTAGTWTSQVVQINAQALAKVWWNEYISGTDTIKVYFRSGSTIAACTSASWSSAIVNPNGTDISNISANTYTQFKIDFKCTDSTISDPQVYAANGYVIQYSYSKGVNAAESSVEFIYQIGMRHFNMPMMDKIFKKIATYHTADPTDQAGYQVQWTTEITSGSFAISLANFPTYWDSFFPDCAFGKEIDITIYKNDLYDFKLHQIHGAYSPQPLII